MQKVPLLSALVGLDLLHHMVALPEVMWEEPSCGVRPEFQSHLGR